MSDIITIGSATIDVFVECDDAKIVSVATKDSHSEFMSYPYGAKVEITHFDSTVGGGGVNTASNFAHLGFDTSAIFKIGDDFYSKGILKSFENKKVNLSNIIQDSTTSTGFSIILLSFEGDRTVLAHRGANAELKINEINFEAIKKSKLVYIAPLNGESNKVLAPVVDFANDNGIHVCFNAGTTSIKKGFKYIKHILEDALVVVMNKEEAEMTTNVEVRPDSGKEKFSEEILHPDIKLMLQKLKIKTPQIVVITDGSKGAYAFDGKKYYKCEAFPSEVVSTLGAGDAFASTFCAAMHKLERDISASLMYASVNSSSVVSNFGAGEGFLTFEQIEKKLSETPDYNCLVI